MFKNTVLTYNFRNFIDQGRDNHGEDFMSLTINLGKRHSSNIVNDRF